MYYQESAIIAGNVSFAIEDIRAIDEYLFLNQGHMVRVERLIDFTNVERMTAESILTSYAIASVVAATECCVCPCDDSLLTEQTSGGMIFCDLCNREYIPANLKAEVVYTPRCTNFECGDIVPSRMDSKLAVDGLIPVAGCRDANRHLDVVFVHGLAGDAEQTWRHASGPECYWPKWINESLPQVGVWACDYDAAMTRWGGDALPLFDRAVDILGKLTLAGFGKRPIVFITHSRGGLIVKQLLRSARELGVSDWTPIAQSIRGIVFIATPHSGSDLSNYMQYLSVLTRPTVATNDLEAHHPRLRELNDWFRNNVANLNLRIAAMHETKPTGRLMCKSIVVDASSANPNVPGVVTFPIEKDHSSICKPTSKSCPVFGHTLRLIEALANAR